MDRPTSVAGLKAASILVRKDCRRTATSTRSLPTRFVEFLSLMEQKEAALWRPFFLLFASGASAVVATAAHPDCGGDQGRAGGDTDPHAGASQHVADRGEAQQPQSVARTIGMFQQLH